jgi:hypothetical protein
VPPDNLPPTFPLIGPLTAEESSPRLRLPYLAAGQAQKHVTVNEAISALDGLVQTAVESATLAAQPAAPEEGAVYILPPGRTGEEWALHPPGALMRHETGDWTELAAPEGCLAYVKDAGVLLLRTGEGWAPLAQALGALQNLARLGLGTQADAANPFAAKLNGALFTARPAAEGGDGDLRVVFNKDGPADVLSLLFQSGYGGRAELGLVGDDRLGVKVSADGAVWRQALTVEPTGALRQPAKPIVCAYRTAGPVTSTADLQPLVFNSVKVDTAGAYDPASGAFTCPAAGCYRVSVGLLLDGSGAAGQSLVAYAVADSGGGELFYLRPTGPDHYAWGAGDTVLSCSEGDVIRVLHSRAGNVDAIIFGAAYTRLVIEYLG